MDNHLQEQTHIHRRTESEKIQSPKARSPGLVTSVRFVTHLRCLLLSKQLSKNSWKNSKKNCYRRSRRRHVGLPGTSPVDDSGIKSAVSPTSLAMSPISNMSLTSISTVSSFQKDYQKTAPGGSPQKTPAQPTTPRRSHRRLPQPTVEQMQAAVAMAAQGPREKSPQPPGKVICLLGEHMVMHLEGAVYEALIWLGHRYFTKSSLLFENSVL
ncbi:uncharacterized protein CEXT_472661 [Caerostris extrusa]|uniref:Uncharacterized protein n=1 Tax=Caerostris extrusa TaxID=172846 RepID=A0AAV4R2W4_CAEEX|nr:uncharacterized protein CEXT_472661 [Caerostris extrusa]